MSFKSRLYAFAGLKDLGQASTDMAVSSAPIKEAVEDRWTIPAGVPYKPEDIHRWIQAAQNGDTTWLYAFCDDMRSRDSHMQSEVSKAEMNIVGSRIDVLPYPAKHRSRVRKATPAGDAVLATDVAAYCQELVSAPEVGFDDACIALANGFWKGLGSIQVIVEPEGKDERIVALLPVPAQRFLYEPNSTVLTVMTDGLRSSAVPVESLGASLVVFQPDGSIPDPARRGLYRAVFPYFAIRSFGPGWWSRFVELFGLPLRKGTYPKDQPNVKADLIESLKHSGNAPWVVVPEGAKVEFESRTSSANSDIHQPILDWTGREISKLFIGSTQTTDIQKGTGSRASASVHGETAAKLAKRRGKRLARCLRQQLLFPLVSRKFGYEVAVGYTPELAFRSDDDTADLLELSQALKNFKDAGAGEAIPLSVVNELGGIPVPEDGEPTLGAPAPPPQAVRIPDQVIPAPKAGKVPPAQATPPPESPAEKRASAGVALLRYLVDLRRATPGPGAPDPELLSAEEWAISQAEGAGEEMLAPYRHILDQAQAEGASLEQVYSRVIQQSGIPPEAPALMDLLAAIQFEAAMRGFRGA